MGKRVHAFPKDISHKGNVIVWLEFEHANFVAAIQQVTHYVKY